MRHETHHMHIFIIFLKMKKSGSVEFCGSAPQFEAISLKNSLCSKNVFTFYWFPKLCPMLNIPNISPPLFVESGHKDKRFLFQSFTFVPQERNSQSHFLLRCVWKSFSRLCRRTLDIVQENTSWVQWCRKCPIKRFPGCMKIWKYERIHTSHKFC